MGGNDKESSVEVEKKQDQQIWKYKLNLLKLIMLLNQIFDNCEKLAKTQKFEKSTNF